MLIDDTQPEETRVVIVNGNKVEDVEFESSFRKQIKGNIYLAKVMRIEPSLQAAFVDYGGNKHGFLAFGEIHPDYYNVSEETLAEVEKEVDEAIEAKKQYIKERELERERYREEKARERARLEEEKRLAEEQAKAQEEAQENTTSPSAEEVAEQPVAEMSPAEIDAAAEEAAEEDEKHKRKKRILKKRIKKQQKNSAVSDNEDDKSDVTVMAADVEDNTPVIQEEVSEDKCIASGKDAKYIALIAKTY